MKNAESKQDLVVNKTILVKATVTKVWDALTMPELTKKYFMGCEVHSDWKVGSLISWTGEKDGYPIEVKGKILEIEPLKRIKYTAWSKMSGLEDIPANHTIVTIVMADLNDATELTVTDENFGAGDGGEKRYQDSVKGWDMILNGLREIVER